MVSLQSVVSLLGASSWGLALPSSLLARQWPSNTHHVGADYQQIVVEVKGQTLQKGQHLAQSMELKKLPTILQLFEDFCRYVHCV